jgi:chemotaxis signal transduction protein
MTNERLTAALASGAAGDAAAKETAKLRLFVFTIDGKAYAASPGEIREIILGGEVHPLPFCPAYITGLINAHGEPHTVIDLKILFDNQMQKPDKFLILNRGDDQAAFAITEVEEIVAIDASAVVAFPESDERGRFFRGSFPYGDGSALWINPDAVLKQAADDL